MDQSLLYYIVIFLGAALIFVPLCKKMGLGSVLGYLVAGLIMGPFGFSVVTDVHDLMHISEFGVVFLMFLIGLELEPKKLWELRRLIFGLGACKFLAWPS